MTETKETGRGGDGNQTDGSAEEVKPVEQRQDAFVVFANEKDLRHPEAIRIKASLYTGIALRVKVISPGSMENLLYAIDLDSGNARKKKTKEEEEEKKDAKDLALEPPPVVKAGILNLRLEECRLTRKAAAMLAEWLKHKSHVETIGLVRVTFDDIVDFKKLTEGMKMNQKLIKICFQHMNFDEEMHGTSIGRVLADSRTIRELDVSNIIFDYKCFYDMSQAILNERCRLNILKMRGLMLGEIEGKILQFILMQNKQLHTLDLSQCRTEDPQNFDFFLQKFDQFCHIRYLTMENMQPDFSPNIETLGEALADNKKLEVLVLRDNKIKWVPYQNFWAALMPNRTIQKVNLQKTDLSDRVIEKIGKYLEQENIQLTDMDLSKNQISDVGLKSLSLSLMKNTSVKFLNLGSNKLREEFKEFVELMKINKSIMEVSFGGNTISNDGVVALSEFLPHNSTLRHLDLSRNQFNDSGFDIFAETLALNEGLIFLDIAKNKEITDEGSLLVLCDALILNKKLQSIDLTGLNIRKPFLKQNFDQALKRNITLQEVFGKIPPNIIQSELDTNIVIEKEVLPLYSARVRPGKNGFDLSLVEDNPENHSLLNLREQSPRLIKAAFKLIRNYDIRSVDFTDAGIHDDALRMLSSYLRSDPNLRSIILDKNLFSDEGLFRLTTELHKNTKLAHLSIKGCTSITNVGLQRLCDVISTTNTCLFQIDLDVDQFDEELALTVIQESQLNRAIQERLKPVKTVTTVAPNGEVVKIIACESALKTSRSDSSESEKEGEKDPLMDGNVSDVDSQNQTNATDTSLTRLKSKLQHKEMLLDHQDYTHFVEVKFSENAKVGECFESAIKAWRIYQPNVIRAENQSLNDEHIQKLCDFLADREMITHLNLRRNFISNAGAKCLGKFISDFDQTLTHLDVTRNLIGQDGGQALLDALNQTTRIVDCQIKYGNPLSNKMGRIIERETHANIQAVSYVNTTSERSNKTYELIDKGPDFMRCAIKMAQIHNILHLSLPDNMLALEDSRMLSDLIKRNTVLRKLNLSQNKLDADCAALIANALVYNNNLQLLDVSQNVLGDLGVYLMLTPLIRKHLQESCIVSKATPLLREKEIIQGKNIKASSRLFKTIPILTELRYLDLEQNMTSCEVFRQIWLAMTIDPDLMIKIENPTVMQSRQNSRLFVSEQDKEEERLAAVPQMPTMLPASIPSKKIAPEMPGDSADNNQKTALFDQNQFTLSDGNKIGSSEVSQNSIIFSEELDTEGILEQEKIAAEKEHQRIQAEKREKAFKRKQNRILCCQRFCCFKDEEKQFNMTDRLPTLTQVMCWRFLKSRRSAVKFHTGTQTLDKLEASTFQVVVSLLISLNYILLYAVVIVPFVLLIMHDKGQCEGSEEQDDCEDLEEQWRLEFNTNVLLINALVLIYAMVCEIVIVMINLKPSNTKCNSYLVCQIFTGLTMKSVILISGQLIAVFFTQIDLLYFVLGIVLASTLVLSQIRAFQIWLVSIRKDKNNLLPRINQNLKICMSTNYLAASTIYSKVCVEASIAAMDQSKALEEERLQMMSFSSFADEEGNKKSTQGKDVKAKLAKCKCCKWTSPKFYQLIMNDIPLLICVPVAYFFGLLDPLNAIVGVFLTLFDLIFMLFYLSYDEEFSIDAEKIFAITENRILEKDKDRSRLLNDNFVASLNSAEDQNMDGDQDGDLGSGQENEQMLTEQNRNGESNILGDTVAFQLGQPTEAEAAKQVADPAGEVIKGEASDGGQREK